MNQYIQERRAKLAAQLDDRQVWLQVAGMLLSEDAVHPIPVCESLFNRCDYAGESLVQMLHSGFYGPINRGKLPHFIAMLKGSQHLVNHISDAINTVIAGSNLIQGFTDQGLPSDPNGRWPGGLHLYGEVFNDWGGGPGGHAGAAKWREEFMAGAAADQTIADMAGGKEINS